MSGSLANKMEQAYRQLREELFCEETGMIYDSISSHEHKLRFNHLPLPEEIQVALPNPHGYATGMEDCMLNAGFTIELCLLRSKLIPETSRESENFAKRLLRGMLRCASVHGKPGYVVRGVSHRDGRSCYLESSRDQFTLFVYSLWRYFHSPHANANEKRKIARVLTDLADFAQSRMNERDEYNLGRLDGFPGMHLRMLEVLPHEAMRLPMFFAAAHSVTGQERFADLYHRYYHKGITESLRFCEIRSSWWHIALSQMQFSLVLCYLMEKDQEHRQTVEKLMSAVAEEAQRQLLEEHLSRLSEYEGSWRPLAHAWRDAREFSLIRFGDKVMRGGKIYLKGEESNEFKEAFDRIRAVGNLAVTVFLAPDFTPHPELLNHFSLSASAPEYQGHTSGGLVNILCAYYMALDRSLFAHYEAKKG